MTSLHALFPAHRKTTRALHQQPLQHWICAQRLLALFAAALGILSAAGCAGPTKIDDRPVVEIKVPVPTPCLRADQIPAAPALASDAQLHALADYPFVLTLWADRLARIQYERELTAALNACIQSTKE